MSNDAFIGKSSVPLVELADQNQSQKWLKLKKRTEKDNVSGEIQLSMTYKYLPVRNIVYIIIARCGSHCIRVAWLHNRKIIVLQCGNYLPLH